MIRMWRKFAAAVAVALLVASAAWLRGTFDAGLSAQAAAQPDWPKVDEEVMRHYQALLRMDTSDPPGKERPAAEYLKQVLDRENIPTEVFESEPNRVNLVAR